MHKQALQNVLELFKIDFTRMFSENLNSSKSYFASSFFGEKHKNKIVIQNLQWP